MAGTVAYMAPEAVQGEPLSPAADVYSLALTIVEALTGAYPFAGSDLASALARRLSASESQIRDSLATVPPALEDILARSLSANPRSRPDAATLRAALAGARNVTTRIEPLARASSVVTALSPSRPRRASPLRGRRAVLLAAGTVAGLGLLAVAVNARSSDSQGGGLLGLPTALAASTPVAATAAASAPSTATPATAAPRAAQPTAIAPTPAPKDKAGKDKGR